jgi:hypothetical protein
MKNVGAMTDAELQTEFSELRKAEKALRSGDKPSHRETIRRMIELTSEQGRRERFHQKGEVQ